MRGILFVILSVFRIFGFAERRIHLGNAENTFPYFSYAPNLLSKLKVRAKEKNKYIYLAFLSVFTTFDLRSKSLTFEKTQIIFGFLLT